ncbi:acyltransferase [Pseudomonas sp. NFXW11]|uniref:acyltransferase family protein n=1 Tax=Pseudomonas sp. NFXW11 TaxID=2819531 RepID=UPI003CEC40B5
MFFTSKSYGDTDFITGMRALAAIAVLFIHTGGAGLREFGGMANNFVDLGKSGVYVFFVISGFSVAQSLVTSSGYLDYLNKRIWRIAPLYYFWIVLSIMLSVTATYWQNKFGVVVDAYNIIMHLGFVSFADYRITNSILGVEWSISIEVFWYLFVPLFVFLSRNNILALVMVVASAAIYAIAVKNTNILPVPAVDSALAMHWSPVPYLFNFCLGVAAFRLRAHFPQSSKIGDVVLCATVALVVFYCAFPSLVNKVFRNDFFLMSLITFVLIVFGTLKSCLFKVFLANRPVMMLGAISYGIYLCHMPIINLISRLFSGLDEYSFAFFAIVTITSCCISLLTYHVIEKPGSAFGKKFSMLPFFVRAKTPSAPI